MKKVFFTVLAAAALSSALFAADKKKQIEFSNELSSDLIHHYSPKNSDDDSHTRFAGISDEVVANYNGDIVNVGVDATASFYDTNEYWDDAPYKIEWTSVDWHIEFNPFKIVAFGFSDELYTEGSYLPVWGDNTVAGNYSTNGFAVLIRPINELTIGAGFDFPALMFGGDHAADAYNFAIGADYTNDAFAIGGSIRHMGVDNDYKYSSDYEALQVGVFASIKAIDKLVINFGFTHSKSGDAGLGYVAFLNPNTGYWEEDKVGGTWTTITGGTGIYGENILQAGVQYDAGKFTVAADLAFNFDGDYDHGYADTSWWKGGYDFYTAVDFNLGLTKKLALDIKGLALLDFGDETVSRGDDTSKRRGIDPTFGVYPKVVFTLNDHHTLYAGIIVQSCTDSDYGYTEFALPVGWKYTY